MTSKSINFLGVEHRRSQVVDPVTEGAVDAIFDAMTARVGLVNARRRLEVPQVVAPLRVAGRAVEKGTVVAIRTNAGSFVVTRTVHVGGVAAGGGGGWWWRGSVVEA